MSESLQRALEAAKQRRTEDRRRMATEPVHDLYGLVAAPGITAARFGSEKLWTVEVVLAAWHEQGGPIRPTLTLETLATDDEVRVLKAQLSAQTVVFVRARGAMASEAPARALLETVHGCVNDDARLNELLTRLNEPKCVHYDALGPVTLDTTSGLYEAMVRWCGNDVKLVLPVDSEHDLPDAARAAQRLLDEQTDWHARVLRLVAQHLLAVTHGAASGGGAKVTEAALRSSITLTSLWVDADGSLDFWFDGGEHFWGDDIHVSGALESGPTDVSLAR